MSDIEELKRQGLSIRAISRLTGFDRKTIRKYLLQPEGPPVYGPRPAQPGKLDAFKPYLEERLKAGVWNAQVLLRELRVRGYGGGYTILKDWLHPQRASAQTVAVRRFETPPGKQAQVDWGHLGSIEIGGQQRRLNGFTSKRTSKVRGKRVLARRSALVSFGGRTSSSLAHAGGSSAFSTTE
ncbi:MAG: hypothetical protein WB579_16055 [Bryobacteraceae bacterium]